MRMPILPTLAQPPGSIRPWELRPQSRIQSSDPFEYGRIRRNGLGAAISDLARPIACLVGPSLLRTLAAHSATVSLACFWMPFRERPMFTTLVLDEQVFDLNIHAERHNASRLVDWRVHGFMNDATMICGYVYLSETKNKSLASLLHF